MRYFNLGMEFAVSVTLLTLGGLFLDRAVKTMPLFTIIGSCLGLAAGGYIIFKQAIRLIRGGNERRDNKKTDTL